MALNAELRRQQRPGEGPLPVPGPDWSLATAEEIVPIRADVVGRLMRDTPGWARWDPGVVGVEHGAGAPAEPGMTCRLKVGTRRFSGDVVQMLIGATDDTTVFAGGGHRWRFIEVIRLRPSGPHATAVQRRVEIHLCGPLRWLRPLVRAYASRHLRRSLISLT